MKIFEINSVKEIFHEIENANSVQDINAISDNIIFPFVYPAEKYPPLNIDIHPKDVAHFSEEGFLKEIESQLTNPAARLLYALAWKNGDLPKIKHIISGIRATCEDDLSGDALVFKQFGKHLSDRTKEPIVDQHILRAFSIYKAEREEDIAALRKQSIFKNRTLVIAYKEWLNNKLTVSLKSEDGWLLAIDKLLFAVGKSAKLK